MYAIKHYRVVLIVIVLLIAALGAGAKEKVILDKYTILEATRTRTIYNWLQYFTPDTLRKELTECGFGGEEFYLDVAGSPYNPDSAEFAVVAKRI